MVDITFNQSGNSVTISASVVYGTDWHDERFNQYLLEAADGTDIVYDGGPTVVYGTLILKNVSYADGESLRTWLRTYAIFQKNTFSISAISNTDLGLGKNTQITTARFLGKSLKGVFEYEAPGIYTIRIPYKFKRA